MPYMNESCYKRLLSEIRASFLYTASMQTNYYEGEKQGTLSKLYSRQAFFIVRLFFMHYLKTLD